MRLCMSQETRARNPALAVALAAHAALCALRQRPYCRCPGLWIQWNRRRLCPDLCCAAFVTSRNETAPATSTAPSAKGPTASACARTATTIARTAAKRVTCALPIAVAVEPVLVLIRLDSDPRLIAGVAAAAGSCASAAGLGAAEAAGLRAAVRTACEQAFGPAPDARLDVRIACRPGRLDVTLSLPGTPADAAAPLPPLAGVDQVQHETRGNLALAILTKFIKPSVPAE